MQIGDKIRKILEEKNMSQKELAIVTKISAPKLNLILTGKRRIKVEEVEIICWALGIGVEKLLTPRAPQKTGVVA